MEQTNVKLGVRNCPLVDNGRYQRLVGKLIYFSHTRPGIGFAVSVISKFMNNPTKNHMESVYQVVRYLKGNPGKGLLFIKSLIRNIKVYCDANWAGLQTDIQSTSGYCTFVWEIS